MAKSKPIGLKWRSSTLFIVSTVGIGLFTDLFLYGLVVPILPFILQDRVNLPHDQIQSHVSGLLAAYAGSSVLFSPPAGILADKLPTRQLPFLVGLVALLGATLLLFLGQNVAVLTIARILQGLSAAVIFGFISIGELAAPILGGVVYKKSGYAGVFGLGFAFLALDFIMRILIIDKKTAARYGYSEEDEDEPNDPIEGEQNGDEEEGNEENEEDPLIRKKEEDTYRVSSDQPRAVRGFPLLVCLKNPRLLTALLLAFVQATLLGTFDATIPTVAQDYYGFSSLEGGLLFMALVLPYLVLGPVAGWAVDRYGAKPAAVIGFGYLTPILILLRLVRPGGKSQIIVYCALLALCGVGMGVIGSPSIVEAAYVVQMYHKANPDFFGEQGPYAQLYSINSMVFSLGLTVGPLVSGLLKDAVGYGNMNIVVAALCLITATLSFIYVGGKPNIMKKKR
ncbi:hypothetical protein P7C71_g1948, partial [Lecanoromycetidae sp. Uapishka_2]